MNKKILCMAMVAASGVQAEQVAYHFEAKIIDKENVSFCQSHNNTLKGSFSFNANTAESNSVIPPFNYFTRPIDHTYGSQPSDLGWSVAGGNAEIFRDESPYSYISVQCGKEEYIWSRENSNNKFIRVTESGTVEFAYGDGNDAPFEVMLQDNQNARVKGLSLTLQNALQANTDYPNSWGQVVPAQLKLDTLDQTSQLNIQFRDIDSEEGPQEGFIKAKLVRLTSGVSKPLAKGIKIHWEGPLVPTQIEEHGGDVPIHVGIETGAFDSNFHAPMMQPLQEVVAWTQITLPTGATLPVEQATFGSSNEVLFHHARVEIKPHWPAGEYKVEVIVTRLQDGLTKTSSKTIIKKSPR